MSLILATFPDTQPKEYFMSVKPVPDGFHTITPYLIVDNVEKQIAWMQTALNAEEMHSSPGPDGRIMHAQLKVGDSIMMLGRAAEAWPAQRTTFYLYVEDSDAWYARAMEAGSESVMEPTDQFYGDRSGGVTGPSGNGWWFSTHKEDLSDEELARRAEESYRQRST